MIFYLIGALTTDLIVTYPFLDFMRASFFVSGIIKQACLDCVVNSCGWSPSQIFCFGFNKTSGVPLNPSKKILSPTSEFGGG